MHEQCSLRGRVVYRAVELVLGRLLQRFEITYRCLHQERRFRRGERLRFEKKASDVRGLQAGGDERLQTQMALVRVVRG